MTLVVNGSTRVLGIVGDPIAQVRAPGVWTALFQHNNINVVCLPMHVRSDPATGARQLLPRSPPTVSVRD